MSDDTVRPFPLWDRLVKEPASGRVWALGGGARWTLRWKFGTVVRHIELGTTGVILTDDGTLVRVLMLGHGATAETGRSVWEPVRADS